MFAFDRVIAAVMSCIFHFQCGEFKYPDVTSPLNRILSKPRSNRFGCTVPDTFGDGGNRFHHEAECSVYSTPDSGMYPQLRSAFDLDETSPGADEVFQRNRFDKNLLLLAIAAT